jgi:general secretion pathway protein G
MEPSTKTGRSSRADHGFTMIELAIVMSIIVILAAMGMAQYRNAHIRAQEAVLREDLFQMRDAMDQFYADKNKWPSALDELVSEGYLRKLPQDPFTKSADTWQTVPAEPDPNNPTAEPGISDVHSGSEGTSLDGSKYSEW